MKIIALIVTHNRLSLLKEAVAAVRAQNYPVDEIVILNNGSTDGTREWLDAQSNLTLIHQDNLGCSDGFASGFAEAVRKQADWVWAMDDDTIPSPDALKELVRIALIQDRDNSAGFICSRVEWSDGNPHLMNLPHIATISRHGKPFNQYDQQGAFPISSCSWVSVLISSSAIKKCGLPYRAFNIWGDDMEYTQRLNKNGLYGLYVPSSIVLHKTPSNYSADLFTDNVNSLWKFRYGIRNHLFMIRNEKGFISYFGKFLKHIFVLPVRIMKRRKTHRMAFVKTIWSAAFASLFFHPEIEQVHG